MRKLFLFLVAISATTLWAYDFQSGDLYYNITSSSKPYTVEVTYKTKEYTTNDYPIFNADWHLDSISIPESVNYNGKTYAITSIGNCAFANCDSLKYVFIPDNVISVGGGIFFSCNSLRNVILSHNITQYPCFKHSPGNGWWEEFGFFEGCSSLTELTISNNVTHIDKRAFFGCSSLTDITIPNSVIEIGGGAFQGCSSLKNIVLSENITDLTYISENLEATYGFFEGCSSLTSITIPDGVKAIGLKTFAGCSSLTTITLPNSVTTVGGGIFYNCSSLKNIVLSDNITSLPTYRNRHVGSGFFEGCSSLTSVIIPKNIKTIGYRAFYGCKNLISLQVEDGNTTYDSRENCNAIIETATNSLIAGCSNTTFPHSVTHIADFAFAGNASLSEITIPNTITSVGGGVFYNCVSLQKVVLSENITSLSEYTTVETHTYPSYSYSYVYDFGFFENCSSLDSIIIPNNVTDIDDFTFAGCSSLTNIIIPNSVTNIGGGVFYNCRSLKDITLSKNISSISDATNNDGRNGWKEGFFENCRSLTSISIPQGINYIGSKTFEHCTSLKKTYYEGDIAGWCNINFTSLSANPISKTHNLFVEEKEISKDLIIPASVRNISNYAFLGLDSIKFIYCHPSTTPTISDSTFSNYDALLFVPIHSLSSYDNHSIWGKFNKIYTGYGFEQDGLYYQAIDEEILSASFLSEEYFNNFTKLSIIGSQTWRYDSKYGAKMSGYDDNMQRTYPNEDWLISPPINLSKLSSATLTFSHAFGPASSIPTTDAQKAQYTCWVSNDFNGDVTTATWTELPITYCTYAWNYIETSVDIPIENLKENCHIAWKYVCSNESATWEIKSLEVTGFLEGKVEVISGIDKYSGNIVIPQTTIKNDVTYDVVGIKSGTFYDCSSLTSLTIPSCIEQVGIGAIGGKSSLTNITITAPSIVDYCNAQVNDLLRNSGCDIPRKLQINEQHITNIIIPDSIIQLGDNAFSCFVYLTSIALPNTLQRIGNNAFSGCESLNEITIPTTVTSLGKNAFSGCVSLTSAIIGNGITSLDRFTFRDCSSLNSVVLGGKLVNIGSGVFSGCTALNEITLPASITSIGENAFAGCTKLYDVYCYAMEPPTAYDSSFANYNAFLHVPCDNQRVYLLDVLFGNFKYIECIEAETATTDTVVVDPSFNDAEFTWPSNSDADTYTLAISKDGEVFCTLTFNANGQLTGIAFAPSRNRQHNAPAAVQAANGFTFTVTGLDEGSVYTYDLVIKDSEDNTLQSYSGEFRTQSTNDRTVIVEHDVAQGQVTGAGLYQVGDTVTLTAIPNEGYQFVRWSNEVEDNPYTFVILDNVKLSAEFEAVIHSSVENTHSPSPTSSCQKIFRNGQLIIIRDGKTYNVMGKAL